MAASSKQAAFFNVGDPITYGKYQNKPGKIVRFMDDGKGNPLVEIEPVPKGKKKNKTIALFKIRHPKKTAARVADRYLMTYPFVDERVDAAPFLEWLKTGKGDPWSNMRSRQAKEFSSPGALKDYLREHPNADPHKHVVRKDDGGLGSGAARTKVKVDKGLADDIGRVWKNKPSSNAVDAVKRMVEKGDEISVNMLGRAISVLKNEAGNASGDEKKALRALRQKLEQHIHQKTASRVASRYLARSS